MFTTDAGSWSLERKKSGLFCYSSIIVPWFWSKYTIFLAHLLEKYRRSSTRGLVLFFFFPVVNLFVDWTLKYYSESLKLTIFVLDCLLEVLRTEDLQKNNEALLYCLGAIKFMSGNAVLLNEMVNKGAVEMLLQLMKQINSIKENDLHFSSLGHLLVQVSIYFHF